MGKVVECRCALQFYTSTDEKVCARCRRNDLERAEKLKRATGHIASLKRRGQFGMNWAVIQCVWRHNLTKSDTCKLLGLSQNELDFEIDIARQNAR